MRCGGLRRDDDQKGNVYPTLEPLKVFYLARLCLPNCVPNQSTLIHKQPLIVETFVQEVLTYQNNKRNQIPEIRHTYIQ
jgi:hypothetical protein